ncbi:MAG TPA: methylglyoxal synthase [Candidatus Eisenbacteria bacterium]|nr:methylglyoxal synthase [Candidatus Eisenbacteria bacterium]
MNIVLIADTRKYDLLVNFCIAYRQILSKHKLISLFNISRSIRDNTDLEVKTLATDISASVEQLASKANYNEIDAVIYIRDPLLKSYDLPNSLFKACDINNIPFATNIATAEVLVLAIDRGDLDWRELIR